MASAQQQILDALQTLLAAGATVAASRVFVDRVDPLQPSELPAILIEEGSAGESVEPYTISGLERRELAVQVHCVLANSTSAAADSRAFGVAVEKLMAASTALQTLAKLGVQLQATRPTLQGDGDRLLATRSQSWQFAYLVRPEAPDILL